MPVFKVRPFYESALPLPDPLPLRFHNELLGQMSAVMLWPHDEKARETYVRSGCRDMQAILEEEFPEFQEHPLVQTMLRSLQTRYGGWSGLRNLRPEAEVEKEALRLSTRATWAGATLFFLIQFQEHHAEQIEQGMSLRKVRSFLARQGSDWFSAPPESEVLKDAWDEFRTVVHFWAAKYFVDNWLGAAIRASAEQQLSGTPELNPRIRHLTLKSTEVDLRTKHVLVYAHRFQTFGLTFRPARSQSPVLDLEALWRIEDLPEWEIPDLGLKIDSDLLEILNDY